MKLSDPTYLAEMYKLIAAAELVDNGIDSGAENFRKLTGLKQRNCCYCGKHMDLDITRGCSECETKFRKPKLSRPQQRRLEQMGKKIQCYSVNFLDDDFIILSWGLDDATKNAKSELHYYGRKSGETIGIQKINNDYRRLKDGTRPRYGQLYKQGDFQKEK